VSFSCEIITSGFISFEEVDTASFCESASCIFNSSFCVFNSSTKMLFSSFRVLNISNSSFSDFSVISGMSQVSFESWALR
jgi:hypothetical protein